MIKKICERENNIDEKATQRKYEKKRAKQEAATIHCAL